MNPVQRMIALTLKEDGVTEVPIGSNRGPRVREYLAITGLSEGYAWCAALIAFCGHAAGQEGGFDWPLPLTADCDVLLSTARRKGVLHSSPETGDIFLVIPRADQSWNATHTGLVTKVNSHSFETIEGNTNDNGDREGYEVCSRVRSFSSKTSFIRWRNLLPPEKSWQIHAGNDAEHVGEGLVLNGSVWGPARAILNLIRGEPTTTKSLRFDKDDQCLTWNGVGIPVQTLLVDGNRYVPLRQFSIVEKLSLEVRDSEKQIVIRGGSE